MKAKNTPIAYFPDLVCPGQVIPVESVLKNRFLKDIPNSGGAHVSGGPTSKPSVGQLLGQARPGDVSRSLSRTPPPSVKPGTWRKNLPCSSLLPHSSAPSTICFLKQAANRSEVWTGALREKYGSGENKPLTRLHHVTNLLQHNIGSRFTQRSLQFELVQWCCPTGSQTPLPST